jgi:hypothetical protein
MKPKETRMSNHTGHTGDAEPANHQSSLDHMKGLFWFCGAVCLFGIALLLIGIPIAAHHPASNLTWSYVNYSGAIFVTLFTLTAFLLLLLRDKLATGRRLAAFIVFFIVICILMILSGRFIASLELVGPASWVPGPALCMAGGASLFWGLLLAGATFWAKSHSPKNMPTTPRPAADRPRKGGTG